MTLLELIAALALSGGVIVAAAMLLDQANDATARIVDAGVRQTRSGTGARVLCALLYDAQRPHDSTDRFAGDEAHVDFSTRCPAAGGWSSACRIALALDSARDSTVVRLDAPGAHAVALRAFRGVARFRYVDPLAADRWTREWRALATLPEALAIVSPTDTIILAVGGVRE